jgi:hypothetical protein
MVAQLDLSCQGWEERLLQRHKAMLNPLFAHQQGRGRKSQSVYHPTYPIHLSIKTFVFPLYK